MNKDGFEITPESGSNNGYINVKADPSLESSKSSEVVIAGGDISKSISIKQNNDLNCGRNNCF